MEILKINKVGLLLRMVTINILWWLRSISCSHHLALLETVTNGLSVLNSKAFNIV